MKSSDKRGGSAFDQKRAQLVPTLGKKGLDLHTYNLQFLFGGVSSYYYCVPMYHNGRRLCYKNFYQQHCLAQETTCQ